MYEVPKFIQSWFREKFGGVQPIEIPSEDRETLYSAHKQALRRQTPMLACLFVVLVAASTSGLAYWRLALDGPPLNVVLNQRPVHVTLGMLAGSVIFWALLWATIEMTWTPKSLGWSEEVYSQLTGWRTRRRVLWYWMCALVMGAFIFMGAWNMGDRVDDTSISFGSPFSRHVQPHASVTAIELYSGRNAPFGVRVEEYLVVRFGPSLKWYWGPDVGGWTQPAIVAQYISDRSGVPVSRAAVRP